MTGSGAAEACSETRDDPWRGAARSAGRNRLLSGWYADQSPAGLAYSPWNRGLGGPRESTQSRVRWVSAAATASTRR